MGEEIDFNKNKANLNSQRLIQGGQNNNIWQINPGL